MFFCLHAGGLWRLRIGRRDHLASGSQWKRKEDRRSLSGSALRPDRASMSDNDGLDDRQSQARAAAVRGARAVNAIEALEDVGQVLLADAYAGIADPGGQFAALGPGANGDLTPGWRVAARVIQ